MKNYKEICPNKMGTIKQSRYAKLIANVRIPDKRAGQGADPYKEYVGAAALDAPLAAILQIAIVALGDVAGLGIQAPGPERWCVYTRESHQSTLSRMALVSVMNCRPVILPALYMATPNSANRKAKRSIPPRRIDSISCKNRKEKLHLSHGRRDVMCFFLGVPFLS